jgi:hypothetical protein
MTTQRATGRSTPPGGAGASMVKEGSVGSSSTAKSGGAPSLLTSSTTRRRCASTHCDALACRARALKAGPPSLRSVVEGGGGVGRKTNPEL